MTKLNPMKWATSEKQEELDTFIAKKKVLLNKKSSLSSWNVYDIRLLLLQCYIASILNSTSFRRHNLLVPRGLTICSIQGFQSILLKPNIKKVLSIFKCFCNSYSFVKVHPNWNWLYNKTIIQSLVGMIWFSFQS